MSEKGIYEFDKVAALNVAIGSTGVKKLTSTSDAFAPEHGIVSIIPVDGGSVTFTATAFDGIGEDIVSTQLFFPIGIRLKSITVSAGACFVGLRVPSETT